MAHIKQCAAIRAGHSQRLIGYTQLEWATTLRAVQLSRGDLTGVSFGKWSACKTQIGKPHLAADEDQRRTLAVIKRGEDSVLPREVGVFVLFARRHAVWDLAACSELRCHAGLGDGQRNR